MATRMVRYIWKIPRPADPRVAQALMSASYQTAMATNPNTVEVLIRSNIHASTRTQGVYRADAPHITIAVKDTMQQASRTHEASHGYTASIASTVVVDVRPSGYSKPDDTKDTRGKEIWPAGLPYEDIAHNG